VLARALAEPPIYTEKAMLKINSMPKAKKLMNQPLFEATLAESGVDALVCLNPKNLFYTTGYPMALSHTIHQRPSGPRSGIAVFTLGGETTLIVGGNEERVTKDATWIEDIRVYAEYFDSPIAMLADVLREKGAAGGKIGLEMEYFSTAFFIELQGLLPQASYEPWDARFEAVRGIKTPEETAIMKRNADLMDEAFLETFQSVKVGETEKEVEDRMILALLRRGFSGKSTYGILQAGQKGFVIHGRSDNPIERGQIICTDFLAAFDGYYANLSRVAVMGPPDANQKKLYSQILDIQRDTAEKLLRPGKRACDVYFRCKELQEELGIWHHRALVGHNMGIWVHEDPMLVGGDKGEFKEGMIVVLEPRFYGYQIQDTFQITANGPHLLSDQFNTDELFVIG